MGSIWEAAVRSHMSHINTTGTAMYLKVLVGECAAVDALAAGPVCILKIAALAPALASCRLDGEGSSMKGPVPILPVYP